MIREENVDLNEMIRHLAAGACARAAAGSVLFPFDTVKARLQFQHRPHSSSSSSAFRRVYMGPVDAFKWIFREEGAVAFFRGLPVRLVYITPSAAVSFALYEQFKRMAHNMSAGTAGKYEPLVWLGAGASARLVGTAVRTPFDIVKQRLQVQGALKRPLYTSSLSALRHVVSREGFRGLFQGYLCTMMRDVPFAGLYFTSYESFKYLQRRIVAADDSAAVAPPFAMSRADGSLARRGDGDDGDNDDGNRRHTLGTLHHLAAGAGAGAFAASCTLPMDVVKLKLQTQNALPVDQRKYLSIPHAWRTIFAEEGVRGFYKGWAPVLLKVTPAASLTFAFYEAFKRILVA
jgi:solute carrier family 25 (mitochondrial iron transporter), member 28/37